MADAFEPGSPEAAAAELEPLTAEEVAAIGRLLAAIEARRAKSTALPEAPAA